MRKVRKLFGIFCLLFSAEASWAEANAQYNFLNFFNLKGYIDGSYNYLLRNNQFYSGNYDRVNDRAENGFTLQQISLTLSRQPLEGFGGFANVIVGRDANVIAPAGINPNIFNNQDFSVVVPQAYFQYSRKNYQILLGEMKTIAGIEQYDYTEDTNFSRSILDGYAQPGIHLGFRGIGHITESLSIIGGLNNGWSTVKRPTELETIELGIEYALQNRFKVMADIYSGPSNFINTTEVGPRGWRNLIDIYGTYLLTQKLSIAENYDYGFQDKATLLNGNTGAVRWQGITSYLNYKFDKKWQTSLRGEVFNDPDGYRTGVKQTWCEATATLGYLILKEVEIRAETRHDFSNVNAFLAKSGNGRFSDQQSYALEVLYKFG